jgi:hypothetical protein
MNTQRISIDFPADILLTLNETEQELSEVTLQLPKTLRRNLETLAEREEVPLAQYIIYVLSCRIPGGYTVQVVPEDDATAQKASFDDFLKKWGKISASEADRILEERENAEPEVDLTPELISKLQKRLNSSRN